MVRGSPPRAPPAGRSTRRALLRRPSPRPRPQSMADMDASAPFYERFWADAGYTFDFALHAAVHARFPAILKVWGSMLAPQRVLDFGCGNGVLTYWMHCNGFGKDIVGVDISATAIAFAARHLARPGLTFQPFS